MLRVSIIFYPVHHWILKVFFLFASEVAAQKNVGEHVASVFQDNAKMAAAGSLKFSCWFLVRISLPWAKFGVWAWLLRRLRSLWKAIRQQNPAEHSSPWLPMTPWMSFGSLSEVSTTQRLGRTDVRGVTKKTSKCGMDSLWFPQLFLILVRCQFLSFNLVTLQFFHPTRSWPFTFQSSCRMDTRVASGTLSASFHCEALRGRLATSRWGSLMDFAKSSSWWLWLRWWRSWTLAKTKF